MTQAEAILAHLESGRTITPLEALRDYGCFRLGARIYDLKQQGHQIERRMISVRGRIAGECRVAEYRLAHPQTEHTADTGTDCGTSAGS